MTNQLSEIIKELEKNCLDVMRHNNYTVGTIEVNVDLRRERAKIKIHRKNSFLERGHQKKLTITEDLN